MSASGHEAAKTTSERHAQEKSQLMTRLSRDKGTWNIQHDRYRLLRALYSFSQYADSAMGYLNYWRDLYKYMSKDQKDVGRPFCHQWHYLSRFPLILRGS